jgi:mono/diheme cytochrome c family protein
MIRLPAHRSLTTRRLMVALAPVIGGAGLVALATFPRTATAQAPARVDFARDVQPILRQNCVGCHGPGQQMIGLRLDRRRDAMRGSTFGTVIGPGNAEASRLYRRISGTTDGAQMPPTGALSADQIAVIKNWINEGRNAAHARRPRCRRPDVLPSFR